jgi:hypothetical protein
MGGRSLRLDLKEHYYGNSQEGRQESGNQKSCNRQESNTRKENRS